MEYSTIITIIADKVKEKENSEKLDDLLILIMELYTMSRHYDSCIIRTTIIEKMEKILSK